MGYTSTENHNYKVLSNKRLTKFLAIGNFYMANPKDKK